MMVRTLFGMLVCLVAVLAAGLVGWMPANTCMITLAIWSAFAHWSAWASDRISDEAQATTNRALMCANEAQENTRMAFNQLNVVREHRDAWREQHDAAAAVLDNYITLRCNLIRDPVSKN